MPKLDKANRMHSWVVSYRRVVEGAVNTLARTVKEYGFKVNVASVVNEYAATTSIVISLESAYIAHSKHFKLIVDKYTV